MACLKGFIMRFLVLFFVFIGIFNISPACAASKIISGNSCNQIGLSKMDNDNTNLVVCLLKNGNSSLKSCSSSTPCIWKNMTETGGSTGSVCGTAVILQNDTTYAPTKLNIPCGNHYIVSGKTILIKRSFGRESVVQYAQAPVTSCPSGYTMATITGLQTVSVSSKEYATYDRNSSSAIKSKVNGTYFILYQCIKN